MKLVIIALTICIAGCASKTENRNEVMTKLINQKKTIEENIVLAHGSESIFNKKNLADSEAKYWNDGRLLNEKLKAINFSIDSLEKMK